MRVFLPPGAKKPAHCAAVITKFTLEERLQLMLGASATWQLPILVQAGNGAGQNCQAGEGVQQVRQALTQAPNQGML